MATPSFDPSQLTESQQAALDTYTAVTNQEPSGAVALLQRSEWNVQIAIAKFFDGEAPDPVEEARAAQSATPASTRRETLFNDSPPSVSPHRHIAPRVVPQPDSQRAYTPPLLLQLALSPFNLLVKLVGSSFSLLGYLLSFIPRLLPGISVKRPASRIRTGRRPLSPRDNAARFAREFEEDYGNHDLPFFEGGYAQAYDSAKKDLKFLLVILLSLEHDETDPFVQDTLLSREVTGYINEHRGDVILWAGNVQDSEAYQVSTALNCSKFPFAALVVHTPQDSSTAMSTIARITGAVSPPIFVAQLKRAIEQQTPSLLAARSQRSEQQSTRDIRTEQNSAYERSLAQDRERARQRREVEAARVREAEDACQKADEEGKREQKAQQWICWRASNMAPEPSAGVERTVRVSVRTVSGQRILRKFGPDAMIEDIYAFVECYDIWKSGGLPEVAKPDNYEHSYNFRLVSPMPRTEYDIQEQSTISSTFDRSANLIVESLNEDEEV
ncbi:uncharacterized protein KY384_006487 [Bacidia gigantensis]|uniref:uncharacterized protein n=1 Tax=Bacidia gigantensis TaxID=2732470 RepID=UPI001D053A61|nr:uncharacterized protein KY384_006487 [Bacidia gigantensis]KAG8528799.1 hypothetical protein KY384_006487 [Bacidia gigantensis]